MAKVLVLYYSTYGHVETLAEAVAEGARWGAGRAGRVKGGRELMARDVARQAGAKLDQKAPIANPLELADYDAIIVGAPTRYGRMPGQMANFLDQTGALWMQGKLNGKIGSAFSSTASQHGGQETTLFSIITNLFHLGLVVVGLPDIAQGLLRVDEITGGTPHRLTTLPRGKG